MGERYAAWIKIGGRIKRPQVRQLLDAIREESVRTEWGDACFHPNTPDELLETLQDNHLWLCNEATPGGEFTGLEQTCRRLRLGYTRCCDGGLVYDAELVDWRPGMKKPLWRVCRTAGPNEPVVAVDQIKGALDILEAGNIPQAIQSLRRLCPVVTDLPAFEII